MTETQVNFKQSEFIQEHEPWPKIPRFFDSDIIISEKIDGTNAQVYINYELDGTPYVQAGSRNRWLTLDNDNFGFAAWVNKNKEALVSLLGPGVHYGEWWGQGIQRGYNMDRKVFSLFNVKRWGPALINNSEQLCVDVVPHTVIKLNELVASFNKEQDGFIYGYGSAFDEIIDKAMNEFFIKGSRAAAKYGFDFRYPEGFMIYHDRSNQIFKVPISK